MDGAEQFIDRLMMKLRRPTSLGLRGQDLSPREAYEHERMQRMANVAQALWFAKGNLPGAVRKETGEALDEVLSGILPALLIGLVIVAASTLAGASLGAIGGFFLGGVGTVPGAVAGGSVGFSAGMWILEWMGLAFLAVHIGSNMYQVGRLVESGFNDAWGHGARDRHFTDRMPGNWMRSQNTTYRNSGGYSANMGGHHPLSDIPGFSGVTRASDKFAQAVAVLIRLVLEGIVLYLTARGIAKLPELVAQLRSSRLGDGFAVWVEKNHMRLMNNPKLKPSAGAGGVTKGPVRTLVDHTTVKEQPRPKKIKKAVPVDTITKIKKTTVSVEGTTISAQRVLPGTSDNVAVVGRNMKGVEPFAEALGKQGIEVETFSGSKISKAASDEFMFFSDKYQGKIPDDVLVQTKMYSENQAWAEGVMNKGYTIADTGNPFGAGKSVFYEMEQPIFFGGTK